MRNLAISALVAALAFVLAAPAHAFDCDGLALSDGCLFTVTGGDTPNPDDGYAVTNADGVPLWDFVRDQDLQAIGYPISQRWTEGPFTLQAFQKVILQWDPGRQRMNFYNTLDVLANRFPWVQLPFVPSHQVLEEDQGASFGTIIRNHLAILDQNPAIKERFLSEPDWLNLYGLPIRYEEVEVAGHPQAVQMLRTQRTVFVVWQIPAPGITVGRVNLQNVPDKLKTLSNVIVPDVAKRPYREQDLALESLIKDLPWVADGIVPAEQHAFRLLQRLLSASPDLLTRLLSELRVSWLQLQPDPEIEGALAILLGIADIPWTRKHLKSADPHIFRMLLHAPREQWPRAFRKLLHKSWIRDGVTWNELKFTDYFISPLVRTDPHAEPPDEWTMIYEALLDMPFLDTLEGFEDTLIRHLPLHETAEDVRTNTTQTAGGTQYALRALDAFTQRGGITDDHALTTMFSPARKVGVEPDGFVDNLDRNRQNFVIDKHTISQARSGQLPLYIVYDRGQPIIPNLAATTQSVLHEVVEFMGVRFPRDYLVIYVRPAYTPRYGQHAYTHTRINQNHIPAAESANMRRILAHLLAHYYWQGNTRWIVEGAATVFEYGLGYRGPSWPPEAEATERPPGSVIECPFDSVVEIDLDGVYVSDCRHVLGAHMFLDLYTNLDRASFHNGFARLFDLRSGFLGIHCYIGNEIGDIPCVPWKPWPEEVDLMTEAFTSDATPEAAAIAKAIIDRWHYGP